MPNLTQTLKPISFADIVGHDSVVSALKNQIINETTKQAIFIQGGSGFGKTSIAHVFIKALTCQNVKDGEPCNNCEDCNDITEERYQRSVRYKHGSNVNIDEARAIEQDALTYDMNFTGKKIFLIDEIQETMQKAPAALKNLLLIMERKLVDVHFIFLTMSELKVPDAIKGRTVYYKLHPLGFVEIAKYLKLVTEKHGIEVTSDKHEALFTIASNSGGSLRNAVSSLESVLERSLWKKEDLIMELNLVPDTTVIQIFNAVMQGDIGVLSEDVTEVHIKKLREFFILYLKGLNGYEYNAYQKKQFQGAKKFESDRVLQVLSVLNSVCEFPYTDQALLDSILLKAILTGKNK